MPFQPDQHFSTFQAGGTLQAGDIIVGLRGGINTKFNFSSFPGVQSTTGTENQVLVNGTFGTPVTGNIVLTTPQDIAPASSPTFVGLTLSAAITGCTSINDPSGNKVVEFDNLASAVNYVVLRNSPTGRGGHVGAAGADTDVQLNLVAKGMGEIAFATTAINNGFQFFSGTNYQHSLIFNMADTANNWTATWQEASGTVAYLSNIPAGSPSALTEANDTNVTMVLSGTPTTALLQPVLMTLGWTGTLATGRGGLGQGATPSDGQIPVGNGGLYTPTAISSGTGILVANAAGSISVGLASIATLNMLANLTGGSTAPTAHTLSAIIDACIGSTQGDILYRNSTVWTVLAPGTSGFFLQTQGAAANPIWAVSPGSGTVNSGTSGQIAYYATTGTAVSGTNAGTGVLTALGVNIGSAGAFVTFNGAAGTPSSLTLTNATGLPIAGITGLGSGVATALALTLNGSGALAATTSPTFVTPILGAATATSINFGGSTLSTYAQSTSWTPTITFDTPGDLSVSYSTQSASYSRIGNIVSIHFVLGCTPTFTTASGNFRIGGFPFALGFPAIGALQFQASSWPALHTSMSLQGINGATYGLVSVNGSAQATAYITTTQATTGAALAISGSLTYLV